MSFMLNSLKLHLSAVSVVNLGKQCAQAGNPVGGAKVRVEERAKDHVASSRGEYWRLLTPGDC